MALGNYQVGVATESLAYPINPAPTYYPKLVVYEAPYEVGDCPVDEIVLNYMGSADSDVKWRGDVNDEYGVRASITDTLVSIKCTDDNQYEDGKSYELRIYPSDEVITR